MTERQMCDLAVVGSGASGLATAVTAAWLGLQVVVIEKEPCLGGASAWSGGWLWVPRNPLAIEAGICEDLEAPLTYLRAELGDGFNEPLCRRFLEQAPQMVAFVREHTALAFMDGNAIPDFHHQSAGSALGGRSVCAAPFDGSQLGARLHDLRPPLDLIAPFGMGIASGTDLRHFLNAMRKPASFLHAARRILRHAMDRLRHGRGLHLVNGNALVARLLKSADDLGITIFKDTPAQGVIRDATGRVTGLRLGGAHAGVMLEARRGVVLAAGGFPHDPARQKQLFPHVAQGFEHASASPRGNTGDGLRLGEAVGGQVRTDLPNAGAWAPVSRVPQGTGPAGHFPHLIERAKPGLIMVRQNGQRFGNEANSYHDLMQALFAATPPGEPPTCFMIVDHAFLRRYGLGRVRPRPFPLKPWLRNGYLRRGATPVDLAAQCSIDSEGLEATLSRYNSAAARGQDPDFGRGEGPYNRIQGEAEQQPNPCVRPIGPGPFYAVRIEPGSLGTFAGLSTDPDARVLDQSGEPIPGLYAVGNDMASMMAGRYPAGGITLGPGMTFAYIAAHHAAGVPLSNNHTANDQAV